jgi:glutamate dehydrogenase
MNALERTQEVIRLDFERMHYKQEVYDLVKEPLRLLTVHIPIRMDNGSVKVFTEYHAQHNDAYEPTKGGIRFHQDVREEEMKALSMWMSIKCGGADLPYGALYDP